MTKEERELMDEKFKGISIQMNSEFEVVHQSLGYIKEQVDRTNGRVTELEANEIQHQINCPQKGKIESLENEMLEYRMIKRYPRFFLLATAVVGFGMLLIALNQMGIF